MTTYADYTAGHTNIRFAQDADLVLGWKAMREDLAGNPKEVRFALHPDGRMKMTLPLDPSHDFNAPGRQWIDVTGVLDDAEFIGHYPADMF